MALFGFGKREAKTDSAPAAEEKPAESGKDGPGRVQKGKRGGRRSKRRQVRNIQS